MGIAHLTRHLLPYSDDALLQEERSQHVSRVKCIQSVVIDGPSLVYHIFQRLLATSDLELNILDVQPTCNEVSTGVMMYLTQLILLGVKVHRICFDGALPVIKRSTRLSRLEKSRKKLELFRSQARLIAKKPARTSNGNGIDPERILQSRTMPKRHNMVLENPFMVPCVFEDLRNRWNKENIFAATRDAFYLDVSNIEQDFPWADLTVMVPGEADIECARISRNTGSAVLSNDSDLLLHDLGPHGSVLFLDTVELCEWNPSRPSESKIKARRLCPVSVARRLGIPNIRHFAYQLNQNPSLGLSELIRRSRNGGSFELSREYLRFIGEYECTNSRSVTTQVPQNLDPRVSEIFSQFQFGDYCPLEGTPHMYLAILNEDHSRRCAWDGGRLYRILGYSILNVSRPNTERLGFVNEHVRRGGRIVKDRITLGSEEWIIAEMESFYERLSSTQAALGGELSSLSFWVLFALRELSVPDLSRRTLPDVERLCRFLTLGHMGEKVEWPDIHLCAQIDAVLYSIRVLKQFLEVVFLTDELMVRARSMIAALPPLHVMMKRDMNKEFPDKNGLRHFFCSLGRPFYDNQGIEAGQPLDSGRNDLTSGIEHEGRSISNPYELLRNQ